MYRAPLWAPRCKPHAFELAAKSCIRRSGERKGVVGEGAPAGCRACCLSGPWWDETTTQKLLSVV